MPNEFTHFTPLRLPVFPDDARAPIEKTRVEAHEKIQAANALFQMGPTAAGVLRESVDALADAGERGVIMLVHNRDVVQAELIRRTQTNRLLSDALYEAVVETARRYARAHRDVPPWVDTAVEALGKPWLYRPEDPRHTHDTDAGGNCRGPWCRYNEDFDRENDYDPFGIEPSDYDEAPV